MLGEHFDDGILDGPLKRSLTVPIDMPSALLNPVSIGVFNALYYHSVRRKESRQRVSSESFFFPLDRIDQWNRLYGKSGFVQYQFVIPKAAGLEGMTAILRRVAASNRASFLGVLKEFGPGNANPLSFPRRGYTLALDLKLGDGLFELLEELDRMVLDSGGRIYLAKDARMSEAAFKRGYSGWEAFQTVRESFGARGRFASRQSRRLGLD
jgi:decaprenylphospho-beta-D-ribofuranose 2-oxidase